MAGSARLGAATDGGALPSTEGLALHDCPGDVAVDVGVADLHARQPLLDLRGVEAVQATGEAVLRRVLDLDGLVEIARAHDAEDGSEALGEVEPRAGLHAPDDAR